MVPATFKLRTSTAKLRGCSNTRLVQQKITRPQLIVGPRCTAFNSFRLCVVSQASPVHTPNSGDAVIADFTGVDASSQLGAHSQVANGNSTVGINSTIGNGTANGYEVANGLLGNGSHAANGLHGNVSSDSGVPSQAAPENDIVNGSSLVPVSKLANSAVDLKELDYPTMINILKDVDVSQLSVGMAKELFQDSTLTALDLAEFKQFVLAVQKGELTAAELGTLLPADSTDMMVASNTVANNGLVPASDDVRSVVEQSRNELRSLLQDPLVKEDLLKGASGDPKKWERLMTALELPYDHFEDHSDVDEDDVDMDLVDEMLQEYLATQARAKGAQQPIKHS